eukprot:TRINITY_DN4457_c0_g2_i1.p2 TRINITY_DN4457_c0_g2~~TRINITY_DN4457_c0_g2_i1.p2  ORF type:complete len:152 (-),score=8.49 TRINITY_DN4457_c0_g2_i1:62-517(-)
MQKAKHHLIIFYLFFSSQINIIDVYIQSIYSKSKSENLCLKKKKKANIYQNPQKVFFFLQTFKYMSHFIAKVIYIYIYQEKGILPSHNLAQINCLLQNIDFLKILHKCPQAQQWNNFDPQIICTIFFHLKFLRLQPFTPLDLNHAQQPLNK